MMDSSLVATVTSTREMFKVVLPTDTVIDAYKGGIEDKLVAFLRCGKRPVKRQAGVR